MPVTVTNLRIPISTEVLNEVYGFRCDGCKVYCSLPCDVMYDGNVSMYRTHVVFFKIEEKYSRICC